MPCHKITGDKVLIFLCGMPGAFTRCGWCGRDGTRLCDYPVGDGKTCDRHACPRCMKRVGRNKDYCPLHKAKARTATRPGRD